MLIDLFLSTFGISPTDFPIINILSLTFFSASLILPFYIILKILRSFFK